VAETATIASRQPVLAGVRAVIFDVDGTLYRQAPLRRAMAKRLARAYVAHPFVGHRTMRILRAYRHAQEELRAGAATGDLAEEQLALAARRAGANRETVLASVERWMELAPLDVLAVCGQPDLRASLQSLHSSGLQLAVLSDYPAEAKLQALGIRDLFDVVVCAQEPEVKVLKPDPRGLVLVLERLGAGVAEALYVGDRADVDAPTARAAGVACAIVGPARSAGEGFWSVPSWREMVEELQAR
jgi:FMN phosphatase YigB (HAD superfamily)